MQSKGVDNKKRGCGFQHASIGGTMAARRESALVDNGIPGLEANQLKSEAELESERSITIWF